MPSASSIPPPAAAADVVPRQRVSDPDVWVLVASWTLITFACIQILLFSFGRDQGIYAVVGDGILHGKQPYRDVWDFKPPGIFLVFAFAEALLGKTMLSVRLVEVAGLVGMVFAFRKLADVFFGERRVGVVAGAIAVFAHAQLEFWHTAQPEAFGGFLGVYALALAVTEPHRNRRWLVWAGVGALFGGAFLMKPTLAGGAFVLAAYLAREEVARVRHWRAGIRPVLVAAVGSWLVIGLALLWLLASGAWDAFAWTMFDFTPGYSSLHRWFTAPEAFYYAVQECFVRFSPLSFFGVIAAITIRPMHSREREGLMLLLGIISINLAGVAMQNKFFPYHYSATLPLLGVIAGLGFYKLWRRVLGAGLGGVLAYTSFVIVVLSMRTLASDLSGTFWSRSSLRMQHLFNVGEYASRVVLDADLYRVADYDLGQNRAISEEIRARVPAGSPIYVWGFEPSIYWLTDTVPASRFIYNVPQRTQWQREYSRRSLMRELAALPPEVVVVQRGDAFSWVTGNTDDSKAALDDFPEFARWLQANYEPKIAVGDFELHERVKENGAPAGALEREPAAPTLPSADAASRATDSASALLPVPSVPSGAPRSPSPSASSTSSSVP
jgi:hypothetical protein